MAERGWREKRDYNHLSPDEFSLFRRMINSLLADESNFLAKNAPLSIIWL